MAREAAHELGLTTKGRELRNGRRLACPRCPCEFSSELEFKNHWNAAHLHLVGSGLSLGTPRYVADRELVERLKQLDLAA